MHMDHHGGPRSPFAIHPGSSHSAGSESQSMDQRDVDRLDRMSNAGPSDNAGLLPSQIAAIMAENHELRGGRAVARRAARMSDIQTRLMDAIGCKSPERLVHDVRNVLNERELYRALADTIQD